MKFPLSQNKDDVEWLHLHAYELCRGGISREYIRSAIKQFTNGFIYFEDGQISGISMWNMVDGHMNILLVCAVKSERRVGTQLVKDLEQYCLKRSIPYMSVVILDSVEPFYTKMGFVKITQFPVKTMAKIIANVDIHALRMDAQMVEIHRTSRL